MDTSWKACKSAKGTPTKSTTASFFPRLDRNQSVTAEGGNNDDELFFGCGEVDDELFFDQLDATVDFATLTPGSSNRSTPQAVSDLSPFLAIPDPSPLAQLPIAETNAGADNTQPVADTLSPLDGLSTCPLVATPLSLPAETSPTFPPGERPSASNLRGDVAIGTADDISQPVSKPSQHSAPVHGQEAMTDTAAPGARAPRAARRRNSGIRRCPPDENQANFASDAEYLTVCMLVVAANGQQRNAIATAAGIPSSSPTEKGRGWGAGVRGGRGGGGGGEGEGGGGGEIAAMTAKLTVELHQHGLKPEIDHVVSGERAVQRVRALARHGLWYRMVVIEVNGSLARAAATARDIRAANPTAPIVAVTARREFPGVVAPSTGDHSADTGAGGGIEEATGASARWEGHIHCELLRHFSEYLTTPVTSANARGLVRRWLLRPPERVVEDTETATEGVGDGTTRSSKGVHGKSGIAIRLPSRGIVTADCPGIQRGASSLRDADDSSAERSSHSSLVGWPEMSLAARHERTHHDLRCPASSSRDPKVASSQKCNNANNGKPNHNNKYHQTNDNNNHNNSVVLGLSASQKGRVFGGTATDRSQPCRLFSQSFEKENAAFEEREFDFVFKHGTIVLRVEEDQFGRIAPTICCACEYATEQLGDLRGKSLQVLLSGAATNRKTAGSILQHIAEAGTDSMCSYINLKSRREGKREVASFVSVRLLSTRPEKTGERQQQRLPAWYVLLKVCLPSTLGLIKEPLLLEKMYSRAAMAVNGRGSNKRGGNSEGASKTALKGSATNTNTASSGTGRSPATKGTPKRPRTSSATSSLREEGRDAPCVPPTTNSAASSLSGAGDGAVVIVGSMPLLGEHAGGHAGGGAGVGIGGGTWTHAAMDSEPTPSLQQEFP